MLPESLGIPETSDDRFLPLGSVPDWLRCHGISSPKGKPLHLATIHRWRLRGISGVRLQTWKVGRGRYTSIQALNSFIDAISQPEPQPVMRVSLARHANRAAAEAQAILGGRRGAA